MITSPANEKIKLVRALQDHSKTRRKERLIVLEGLRLVRDALEQGHAPQFLLATSEVDCAWLADYAHTPLLVTPEVFRAASATQQPQGLLGVFPMPSPSLPPQPPRLLILDALRDPGNLGTILRTAGAAGVSAVLCSPTCVDPYNPKALRAGMGAHFRLPLLPLDWAGIQAVCGQRPIYLADGAAAQLYSAVDWSGAWALIIGSEAHGAGDHARQLATMPIRIPMAAATESLNAAAAAAVILFASQHP